jgi:hypothetical protein
LFSRFPPEGLGYERQPVRILETALIHDTKKSIKNKAELLHKRHSDKKKVVFDERQAGIGLDTVQS